jgi:hypothetical protein
MAEAVIIGTGAETGEDLSIGDRERCGGLYVLGKPRTGKSHLLISLALQDMEHDLGLLFIDPHADAIQVILDRMPARREKDVIILDPTNDKWAFGVNPLYCRDPVWSKNSCGFPLIVFQEPAEPFATPNRACTLLALATGRKEQHIALSLMISLVMVMVHVLVEHMPKSTLAKQNHPRQDLVLDGAYPSFRIGVQIGAPRWQRDPLHACRIDDLLKRGAELAVSVVNEVLPWSQEPPLRHRHVPGHLHHPGCIGMRCYPCHMHLAAAQVNKEQHIVGHQSVPRPHLGAEEVGCHQYIHMGADKFVPGGGLLALWSG